MPNVIPLRGICLLIFFFLYAIYAAPTMNLKGLFQSRLIKQSKPFRLVPAEKTEPNGKYRFDALST